MRMIPSTRSYTLLLLAILILFLITDSGAAGDSTRSHVAARIDSGCNVKPGEITVPAGMIAKNFSFGSLRSGVTCTTGMPFEDTRNSFGIYDALDTKVYEYIEDPGYGNPYEEAGPIGALTLSSGTYSVLVGGGNGAHVTVAYDLVPSAGYNPTRNTTGLSSQEISAGTKENQINNGQNRDYSALRKVLTINLGHITDYMVNTNICPNGLFTDYWTDNERDGEAGYLFAWVKIFDLGTHEKAEALKADLRSDDSSLGGNPVVIGPFLVDIWSEKTSVADDVISRLQEYAK